MKYLFITLCIAGIAVLISPEKLKAADFSFYMWNQEISGTAIGQDSSTPGTTSRVTADLEKDTNNEKGFRLVAHFLGLPTEFGYTTLENSTMLHGSGTFSFNGQDFDTTQNMNYVQDAKIYEFFPRIPLPGNDKIGMNLLLGVKYMSFKGSITGKDPSTGTDITESLDEDIPIPQIGARFYIGSLKKGLRVELMAKYLDLTVSGVSVKSLDAEAIAYVKTTGGLDFFFGWRMMDQTIITDENDDTEAGLDLKNSGLIYGGRIRF